MKATDRTRVSVVPGRLLWSSDEMHLRENDSVSISAKGNRNVTHWRILLSNRSYTENLQAPENDLTASVSGMRSFASEAFKP